MLVEVNGTLRELTGKVSAIESGLVVNTNLCAEIGEKLTPLVAHHETCTAITKVVRGDGNGDKGLVSKVAKHHVLYKVAIWAGAILGSAGLLSGAAALAKVVIQQLANP